MELITAIIKYVIFTLNFIIWLMGGALLGVGIWLRTDSDFFEYHKDLQISQYYQASYIAITVGAIILMIAFFGCCGAAWDSPCMLFFYFLSMVVIMVLELCVAGLIWKHGDGEKFQEFLTNSIKYKIDQSKDSDEAIRFVKLLQLHLECCGGFDKNDYHEDDIPESCSSSRTNNIFIHGCGENLRRYLEQKAGLLGGLALGIVLIQIIALMFTGCLFMSLREEAKDYF